MENKIRSTLNEIYFGKTKDVVNDLRCLFVCLFVCMSMHVYGVVCARVIFLVTIHSFCRTVQGVESKTKQAMLANELRDTLRGRTAKT